MTPELLRVLGVDDLKNDRGPMIAEILRQLLTPFSLISASGPLQAADGTSHRDNRFVTSYLNHFTGCVEDTQLTTKFLGKETYEMNRRAWFSLVKYHRFRQLSSAQFEAIV